MTQQIGDIVRTEEDVRDGSRHDGFPPGNLGWLCDGEPIPKGWVLVNSPEGQALLERKGRGEFKHLLEIYMRDRDANDLTK